MTAPKPDAALPQDELQALKAMAKAVVQEWESHNGSDGAVYLISAKALKVCTLLAALSEARPVLTDEREAFEAAISGPPYERSVARFPDDDTSAWPGNYRNIDVDLAWCMWQARAHHATASEAQPEAGEPAPFSAQRVAVLVPRLRELADLKYQHHTIHVPAALREAADMLEELAALADSEGTRAVKYLRRAREAEAAIAAQPPASQVGATGVYWLVESKFKSATPRWWNGKQDGDGVNVTADPNAAIRFARKEDAEKVAAGMHMFHATEHVWPAATPASPPATPVVTAVMQWWESKRPIAWDVSRHLEHPEVNVSSIAERQLARTAASLAASPQPFTDAAGQGKDQP